MKIPDSLRKECMPEMVYSICKLAGSKSYKRDEIRRLITLDSNELDVYKKVFRFSIECGFISESADETVAVNFNKDQLSDFKKFRHTVAKDIFRNSDTSFTSLSKWFLSQGTDVFTYKSAQELAVAIPHETYTGIEKDYILGFRFWLAALGFGMFTKSSSSEILVFSVNNILDDWLSFDKPFPKGKPVLAREFFKTLIDHFSVFSDCLSGNGVNLALSMGLRVLHLNNVIELKNITDSGDIWHLTDSISNPDTNNITDIIVR